MRIDLLKLVRSDRSGGKNCFDVVFQFSMGVSHTVTIAWRGKSCIETFLTSRINLARTPLSNNAQYDRDTFPVILRIKSLLPQTLISM
jgi:hypothetical protein